MYATSFTGSGPVNKHTRQDDTRVGVTIMTDLLWLECSVIGVPPSWQIWTHNDDLATHAWSNMSIAVEHRKNWMAIIDALRASPETRDAVYAVFDAIYARSLFHAECAVNFSRSFPLHDECGSAIEGHGNQTAV